MTEEQAERMIRLLEEMNEKLKEFIELFNNLEKKAKKNGTKD